MLETSSNPRWNKPMSGILHALMLVVFANAFVSFLIFFFWQAKVILTLDGMSDYEFTLKPWKGLGEPNSLQTNHGRFFQGEILPDLKRKWAKAATYLLVSTMVLFACGALVEIFSPSSLGG
jgi:hypothetical protein